MNKTVEGKAFILKCFVIRPDDQNVLISLFVNIIHKIKFVSRITDRPKGTE
jgi:hypothetical protein